MGRKRSLIKRIEQQEFDRAELAKMKKKDINVILSEISEEMKDRSSSQAEIKEKLNYAEKKLAQCKRNWKKEKNLNDYMKKFNELKDYYHKEIEQSVIIIETDGREEQRHKTTSMGIDKHSSFFDANCSNSLSRNKYVEVDSNSIKDSEIKKEEIEMKVKTIEENKEEAFKVNEKVRVSYKMKIVIGGVVIVVLVVTCVLLLVLLLVNRKDDKSEDSQ